MDVRVCAVRADGEDVEEQTTEEVRTEPTPSSDVVMEKVKHAEERSEGGGETAHHEVVRRRRMKKIKSCWKN